MLPDTLKESIVLNAKLIKIIYIPTKMTQIILLSVLIIAISWLFIAVKVVLKKNGKMTSQHIHDSPAMRRMGIHCVVDQDRESRERAERKKRFMEKIKK